MDLRGNKSSLGPKDRAAFRLYKAGVNCYVVFCHESCFDYAHARVMTMTAKPANSVAAVVVTHDRLSLLKNCVAALRAQTRPLDAIIVADNGSTDGTREWLAGESDLKVVSTQANLGTAGGYYTGMKAAHDQGYDWLWIMDDDGLPDVDCLRQQLAIEREDLLFRGALVLAPDDRNFLSLGYGLGSPPVFVQDRAVAEKYAQDGLLWGAIAMTSGGPFLDDERQGSVTVGTAGRQARRSVFFQPPPFPAGEKS